MPEANAEGVFSLDWTQYDMMNEGTDMNLNFAFCASGNSARVSMTKGRVPRCCCNSEFSSESDTTNVDMKKSRGVGVTAGERNTSSPQQVAGFFA